MGNYLRIPGETPLPYFRPPRPRSNNAGFLALVFLFLFCSAGYALVKYWPSLYTPSEKTDAPRPVVVNPTSATIPMAEAEDLVRHLEDAIGEERVAAEQIKRSQEWMERVAPSIRQNYMALEPRRLHAAAVASESARRHIEQAREESEITKNLLIERSK